MVRGRWRTIGWAPAALAVAAMAAPAQAQFGRLLRGASPDRTSDGCAEGESRSSGSRIAGGILGSLAGSAAGRVGGVLHYVPVAELADQLTASIACRLDPEEQKQAADATLEATRAADGSEEGAPEVGQMAAWTSNTRDDVSGTSTVVASDEADADGLQCITVTDVIIVDGEEARADKRMCRRPPARYAIVA